MKYAIPAPLPKLLLFCLFAAFLFPQCQSPAKKQLDDEWTDDRKLKVYNVTLSRYDYEELKELLELEGECDKANCYGINQNVSIEGASAFLKNCDTVSATINSVNITFYMNSGPPLACTIDTIPVNPLAPNANEAISCTLASQISSSNIDSVQIIYDWTLSGSSTVQKDTVNVSSICL